MIVEGLCRVSALRPLFRTGIDCISLAELAVDRGNRRGWLGFYNIADRPKGILEVLDRMQPASDRTADHNAVKQVSFHLIGDGEDCSSQGKLQIAVTCRSNGVAVCICRRNY